MKNLLIFLLFIITSCTARNNTLIIGTNAVFPPFEYIEDEKIVGFDIDLINAIAKELNREIVIKNLSWEELFPALQNQKVDLLIAGLTVTRERRKIVNFSDTYYNVTEPVMIVHVDNNDTVTSIKDLIDKRVGIISGCARDLLFNSVVKKNNVVQYNNLYQAVLAIKNNQIDTFIMEYPTAKEFIENNSSLKIIRDNNLEENKYAIALPKGNTRLLNQINTALQNIHENGTYKKIYDKYF